MATRNPSENPTHSKLIFLAIIVALVSIGASLLPSIYGKLNPQDVQQSLLIKDYILTLGILGPVVFIVLTVLANILAPLSSTPIILSGVYIFNEASVVYLLFATGLSYVVNFLIAKVWGRKLVIKLVGKKDIEKIDNYARKYGLVTLILLRLSQMPGQEFISYAAGFTTISFRDYIAASIVATIPMSIVLYEVVKGDNGFEHFIILYLVWSLVFVIPYWAIVYAKSHVRRFMQWSPLRKVLKNVDW